MRAINVARPFVDKDGKDIREPARLDKEGNEIEPGALFTLQSALFVVLTGNLPGDEKLTDMDRFKNYRITQRVMGPTIPAPQFAAEEVAIMKERIARGYPGSWIMGQAWDMLDPPADAKPAVVSDAA